MYKTDPEACFSTLLIGNQNSSHIIENIALIKLCRKTDINDKDARHLVIMASWDGMSGLVFGHPKTSTTHTSYLWKNEGGSYDLIRPYVWHHVCYSFAAKGYSRIVLVNN